MKIKLILLAALIITTQNPVAYANESQTAKYYDSIKTNPQKLTPFLTAMPKGGDLHNHQSGSTFPENLLRYSANDNLCIDRQTFYVSANSACAPQDLLQTAIKSPQFRHQVIDAWSMQHFAPGKESGHDHFFATFGKVGVITGTHHGEILSEIAGRAAQQNELYLELMSTVDDNVSGKLGKSLGWDADYAAMRKKLLAANFDHVVATAKQNMDNDLGKMKTILACGTDHAKPGCQVEVRFLYQILREQPPEMVFAQMLAGLEIASKDPRVVGLNMVQPEDGKISMQDYKLQMQMLGYLHTLYPNVKISLHAGELTNALVPEEGLKFHINNAVNVAKANRIGHGVDIAQENNVNQLLTTMAKNHILAEINLSSNAYILNVQGKNHPLPLYMRYGVPVTLSTDDEGVSLEDMTTQYLRAVKDFQFSYQTLKQFSRNSIAYAFLPGQTLWVDDNYRQVRMACVKDVVGSRHLSSTCKGFLAANEKAAMQWKLEERFVEFERQAGKSH